MKISWNKEFIKNLKKWGGGKFLKIKCGGGKFLKKVVVVKSRKYLENRGVFIIYQGGSFGQYVGEWKKRRAFVIEWHKNKYTHNDS